MPARKSFEKKLVSVLPVTEKGYALSKRLSERYKDLLVYTPGELKGDIRKKAAEAFAASSALVFISASGIAVRAIAPLLKGKETDPAVVVMDERARFVISLVSGHLGGANRLAREIASIYGATPVITTATDISGLPCVEEIAERFSLNIDGVKNIKAVNSSILKGEKIAIIDRNKERLKKIKGVYGGFGFFSFKSRMVSTDCYASVVLVSEKIGPALKGRRGLLLLRPREFVLGIGCRRGVYEREIEAAVGEFLGEAGVSMLSIRNLATIDIKGDEEGLLAFVRKNGLSIEFFTASELKPAVTRVSRFVEKVTGAGAVSEPAALISSGAEKLCLKKRKYEKVTLALARAPFA